MKIQKQIHAFLSTMLVALITATVAIAAQDSTVISENAPIRMEPKTNAKILEYLPMGTEVRISSFPMAGGWYKVRSRAGLYGWLNEKFLSVYKPAAPEQAKNPQDAEYKPERDRKWFIRGLGGFGFFRPEDLNAVFDFQDLNTGYYAGGEFGRFISDRVAIMLRAEAMFKDIIAKEKITGIFFNLGLRSYPVMAGFDFHLLKLPAMRLSFGILGGVALATSFASEASALTAPNVMVLQRSPFTTLARLNLTRPLGRVVSVFAEIGYRYLRTDEVDTTAAADISGGRELYMKDGAYKSRIIDLSGVTAGVGIGLHF